MSPPLAIELRRPITPNLTLAQTPLFAKMSRWADAKNWLGGSESSVMGAKPTGNNGGGPAANDAFMQTLPVSPSGANEGVNGLRAIVPSTLSRI